MEIPELKRLVGGNFWDKNVQLSSGDYDTPNGDPGTKMAWGGNFWDENVFLAESQYVRGGLAGLLIHRPFTDNFSGPAWFFM